MSKVKILDCTLRDGGYYNLWDFDENVVQAYLKAIANAGIDYVELGLRSFPKNGFVGGFAYSLDCFLERLNLPEGPIYGVMVDAKTILESNLSIKDAINALFSDSSDSKINLVRIAAHFHEVEASGEIVKILKEKGYMVGFNLMQSGGKSEELIIEKARIANSWQCLDVLYFADSLGNMDATEVVRIITALKTQWHGEMGIHTHDNMAKAIENTLVAKDNGVKWLDVTVTGMGRGAGNAQTEKLLAIFSEMGGYHYSPTPIYDLVIRYFEPLQKKHGWGSSLLYFLGAQNDVHPTYVQKLLSDSHYGADEIVGAIGYLSELAGTSLFKGEVLSHALSFNTSKSAVSGNDEVKGLFDDKEVLILGSGDSVSKYLSEIEAYISEVSPIVIAINIEHQLSPDYVDYYCISHNNKFLAEKNLYTNIEKPIILPKHLFSPSELELLTDDFLDFGLEVESGVFRVNNTFCVLPFELTIGYALAVVANSKTKCVNLVGFDGYEPGDVRQIEMIELLNLINQDKVFNYFQALTPTTYPIKKASIYARSN